MRCARYVHRRDSTRSPNPCAGQTPAIHPTRDSGRRGALGFTAFTPTYGLPRPPVRIAHPATCWPSSARQRLDQQRAHHLLRPRRQRLVVLERVLVHVDPLADLQLHRLDPARGVAVLAGDVATLEAAV